VEVYKNPNLGFSIAGGIDSSSNPFHPNDKKVSEKWRRAIVFEFAAKYRNCVTLGSEEGDMPDDYHSTIPIKVLHLSLNELRSFIIIPTKAEERSLIQISFRN